MKRLFLLFVLLILFSALIVPAYAQRPVSDETVLDAAGPPPAGASLGGGKVALPTAQSANIPESISGSYVYATPLIGGDACFAAGLTQTFCFQAISYTNDNDYVYYLWQRFPSDWTVTNVYVSGTPYCTSGGTFGAFSWWSASANEVRITHVRYHANPSDACSANYCFVVSPGSPSTSGGIAWVPWYWVSSTYGSPPFYPCSSDGYTPSGQVACDEMTTPPAHLTTCAGKIYLPLVTQQ